MADAIRKPLITADELLRMDAEGARGELIQGVFSPTEPSGMRHGVTVANMCFFIGLFTRQKRLGIVTGPRTGVWLERDPDTVRESDAAFYSAEKDPPGSEITSGYAETVPDLVVEVASHTDSLTAINDKAFMWLSYGARLVWTVHPDTREVNVYRKGSRVRTLCENDVLDGADVLPGFACKISQIFEIYPVVE